VAGLTWLRVEWILMADILLQSALKLSKAERILLVEQIWDSIAAQRDNLDLTAGQMTELRRRVRRLRKTGPRGSDWASVKKRLTHRSGS